VGQCIVDMNNQFSLRWIWAIRQERVKQGNQVLFNEPFCIERRPGGNIVTTWNPTRGDSIT
jgi:hypothetical protein